MELLSMNVPRYTVKTLPEKTMPLSSRDMISTFHCSCMEYFHILSPENLTLSHLKVRMSH